jgi:tetratricopeptide (TPR) repeat protein
VKAGNDKDALKYLQAAAKLNPSHVPTQMLLARLYQKQGDDATRVIHLENAYKLAPNDFGVNMELGIYYADKGSHTKASGFLRNAVTVDPVNADAHYQYARVLEALSQDKEALSLYSAAAAADPANLTYAIRVVEVTYAAGAKDAALKAVETALTMKDSEKNAKLQYWAGVLFFETDKAPAARAYFERAVSLDKSCSECCDYLGDIASLEGKTDDAAKYYTRSLDIKNTNPKTEMKLGMIYIRGKKPDMAEKLFEGSVGRNSANDEARYWLCHLYMMTDRLDMAKTVFDKRPPIAKTGWFFLLSAELLEAQGAGRASLDAYKTAARMLPQCAQALAGYGRSLLNAGDFEQAIMYLGQAMGADPGDQSAMVEMGRAYELQKDVSAALDIYKEVLRNDPQNEDAYFRTALVLGATSGQKAIETLQKGLAANPRSGKLYVALGDQYQSLKQYENALDAYRKAERQGQKQPLIDALRAQGDIYFQPLADPKKAKGYYERYIKEGGSDSAVKIRLQRL